MPEETQKCPYCREEIIADAIKCKHCGSMLPTPPTTPYDTLDSPLVGTPTAGNRVFSGRYRIIKELGRGGMGVVYLAHDDELDMDVAVKFLPVELANDRRALEQLRSEAKLSMTLTHDNIMRLHNLDTSGQFKFLVMEYVDGPSLLDVLREKERLPLDEALPIIKAICDGVDYAHSKRVLHRDLKPANIMLTSEGEVKVTDFGIARRMRESMSKLSQKTISGTPAYMAPEHIMGEHITVRSDIYSLGAVAYELLAGHPPFYEGDIPSQIRFKVPPPIPGIPEPLNAAVRKPLSKDANKRPASATEFYKALIAICEKAERSIAPGGVVKATPPPPVPVKAEPLPSESPEPPEPISPAKPPEIAPTPALEKRSSRILIAAIVICLSVLLIPILVTILSRSPELSQPDRTRKVGLSVKQEDLQAEAKRAAQDEHKRNLRENQGMTRNEQRFKELLRAARKAVAEKRYDKAIRSLQKALEVKPDHAEAYFMRGLIKHCEHDDEGAISDYNKVIELDPKYADAYYWRGIANLNHGCFHSANADFTEAIKLNPEYEKAYVGRGIAKSWIDKFDGAIADFTKAIELNPKNAVSYNNRGLTRSKKGAFDGAIADCTKAIQLNPKYAEAYNNRGRAKDKKGDLEGAIADFNKAIALNPKYAEAYLNRGLARKDNEFFGAMMDYSKAIELKPKYAEAYHWRGHAKMLKGYYESSLADFDKAIELNPKYAEAYVNRGIVKGWKNDIDGEIADYSKAIELNPKDAIAYSNRALAKSKKGDIDGAIADYSNAIKVTTLKDAEALLPGAYSSRGIAKGKKGDLNGAIADFTRAIQLNPKDALAYQNRGVARRLQGDKKGAEADFAKARQLGFKPK